MKRIFALLLAMVLLATSVMFTLTSCGDDPEDTKDPTTNNNGEEEFVEGDIFAERAAIDDELEDVDYGGRKFRVVLHNETEVYVPVDQRNKGDLILDAKQERNSKVENRFNIEIEPVYVSDINSVADWVSKNVLSGADEFDLLVNHVLTTGGMVTKNLFVNWYDVPNVDFSKPWWAASTTNELTYDGKCILAVSDFNYSSIGCTYCMVFNKNLANSYDLGNLYQTALDGDWTFDYFVNLVKDIWVDTDGTSDKSTGDFFGMVQPHHSRMNQWLWAFDNPIMTKNEEGVPTISIKTDKINNIVASLYDYCFNLKGVAYQPELGDDADPTTMFLEKKSLFMIIPLWDLTGEGFRNFEDEYGVLPLPKWNENQKEYKTQSYGEHTVSAIPKTVKDLEYVGTIVEALSAESYKTVTPTLYEIALKTRYLRDSESKEVLDIVINSRLFDFGYVYDNWKGFGYTLQNMFANGQSNFESYYSKTFNGARTHYKKVIKAFDKLA